MREMLSQKPRLAPGQPADVGACRCGGVGVSRGWVLGKQEAPLFSEVEV